MEKLELNNGIKEHYIEKVEDYNSSNRLKTGHIVLNILVLTLLATSAVANNAGLSAISTPDSADLIRTIRTVGNLVIGVISLKFITLFARTISEKIGINAKIEEIQEMFEMYGLVLNDEISKGKGL